MESTAKCGAITRPLLALGAQGAIEVSVSSLQHKMRASCRQTHLLTHAEAISNDGVDSAFDKADLYAFTMPSFLCIARDHQGVAGDVGLELGRHLPKCLDAGIVFFDIFQIKYQVCDGFLHIVQVAIPKEPFDLAQQAGDGFGFCGIVKGMVMWNQSRMCAEAGAIYRAVLKTVSPPSVMNVTGYFSCQP